MFRPEWLQFIYQYFSRRFLGKTNSITWDAINNSFKVTKGSPGTISSSLGFTFDANHFVYAEGDSSNNPAIRLYRSGAAGEIRMGSASNTASAASAFTCYRTLGTGLDNPLAVTSGTYLGLYRFHGWDGSAWKLSAFIAGIVDGSVSSAVVPTTLSFFTTNNSSGATEKLRLSSGGGLSLGSTSDPGAGNFYLSGAITNGTWNGTAIAPDYLPGFNGLDTPLLHEDFLATASVSTVLLPLGIQATASGTGAGVSNTAATASGFTAGSWTLSSGSVATNYVILRSTNTSCFNLANGRTQYTQCRVRIPTLPNGTDDFKIWAGFGNSTTGAEPTDGAYLFASSANANWQAVVVSNSSRTSIDTGVAVSTGFNVLKVSINPAGTSINFYINGALVNTATNALSGRSAGLNFAISKQVGTNSLTFVIDKATYWATS